MARNQRGDGRMTKEKLLECAGRLTAQKGFAAVTSKEICEMAGTNLAAVNYHFGSRAGLHREMMMMVHRHFVSEEFLQKLCDSAASPRERLEIFIDELIDRLWSSDEWLIKAWIRELLTPSAEVEEALKKIAMVKGRYFIQLFCDYTGRALDDPKLYSAAICFVAPFVLTAAGKQTPVEYSRITKVPYNEKQWAEALKEFAFAGLDKVSKNISITMAARV